MKTLRFAFSWVGLVGFYLLTYSVPQLVFALLSKRQHTHLVLGVSLSAAGLLLLAGVSLICHFCWQEDLLSDPEPLKRGGEDKENIRWADFYASADPVPNGPLFSERDGEEWLLEREVWNFGSVVRDHTTYTSSEDDFMGCVIAELFRATDVTLSDQTQRQLKRARWRGWWRVWWLVFARVLAVIAAIVTVYRVWGNLAAIGGRIMAWSHRHLHLLRALGHALIDAVQKLIVIGHASNQQIVGALAVLAVVIAGYFTIAAVWAYWQKQDIKRFYQRLEQAEDTDPLGGREFILFGLTLCLLGFMATVVGISRDYARPWNWGTGHPWFSLAIAAALVVAPVGLAWAFRGWLRKAENYLVARFPRS